MTHSLFQIRRTNNQILMSFLYTENVSKSLVACDGVALGFIYGSGAFRKLSIQNFPPHFLRKSAQQKRSNEQGTGTKKQII